MTSREAAITALGIDAVRAYEAVKTFYTRYGHELEHVYSEAVGGRLGQRGEPDVITRLGAFEFCAAANTKNSAGDAAQLARVGPGRIVQVTGTLKAGRISGVEFLKLHGARDAERLASELEIAALHRAKAEPVDDRQIALPL